jgi:glutathione S-transferase
MTQPQITLYSFEFSPFASKVRCFLGRKGLDYSTTYVRPFHEKEDLPLGHQVPALTIGEEARNDSTPIGIWLDEMFPDRPTLLPPAGPERDRLLEIDAWVTKKLVPLSFRFMVAHGASVPKRLRNRKRGAQAVHKTSGYPQPWRSLHPFVITRAGFIRKIMAQTDPSQSNADLLAEVADELVANLEGGAYFAGRTEPSLPDFAAYAQFALPYRAGYDDVDAIEDYPDLMAWITRVRAHLPDSADLAPDLVERNWL